MKDIRAQILAIAGPAHLASLATISEDGKPWVRYVILRADTQLIFRIATRVSARKVAQIQKNPEVHLTCGATDPRNVDRFLQVQGRAEFTTTQAERDSFWDPHLSNIFEGPNDPEYGVIRIIPYRIEVWKEGSSTPEVWESPTTGE